MPRTVTRLSPEQAPVIDPFEVEWNLPAQVTDGATSVATAVGASPGAVYTYYRDGVWPLMLVKAICTKYELAAWPFDRAKVSRAKRGRRQVVSVIELARQFDLQWPNKVINCVDGERLVIPPLPPIHAAPKPDKEVPAAVHAEPGNGKEPIGKWRLTVAEPEHPLLAELRDALLPQANSLDVILDLCARVAQERNHYAAQVGQLHSYIDQQTTLLERLKADLTAAHERIDDLDRQLVNANLKPVTPFANYSSKALEEAKTVVAKRHPSLLVFMDSLPKSQGHLSS